MFQDLRFGFKLLWKEKAFSITALLTLALCIGANTSIFTVLNSVILEPLPFPESERLVTMYNIYPGVGVDRGSNGIPDYLDRRQLTDVFESVALFGNSAPRHRRGRNAAIGVSASTPAPIGRIGPCAE